MPNINWSSVTRNVNDLKPYNSGLTQMTPAQSARLRQSIQDLGYAAPIIVDADNTIISGNARYQQLKEMGEKDIDVRLANRALTDQEKQRLNFLDNVPFNQWNAEQLQKVVSTDDLSAFGLDQYISEYKIVVTCKSQDEQKVLLERLQGEGYDARVMRVEEIDAANRAGNGNVASRAAVTESPRRR